MFGSLTPFNAIAAALSLNTATLLGIEVVARARGECLRVLLDFQSVVARVFNFIHSRGTLEAITMEVIVMVTCIVIYFPILYGIKTGFARALVLLPLLSPILVSLVQSSPSRQQFMEIAFAVLLIYAYGTIVRSELAVIVLATGHFAYWIMYLHHAMLSRVFLFVPLTGLVATLLYLRFSVQAGQAANRPLFGRLLS